MYKRPKQTNNTCVTSRLHTIICTESGAKRHKKLLEIFFSIFLARKLVCFSPDCFFLQIVLGQFHINLWSILHSFQFVNLGIFDQIFVLLWSFSHIFVASCFGHIFWWYFAHFGLYSCLGHFMVKFLT